MHAGCPASICINDQVLSLMGLLDTGQEEQGPDLRCSPTRCANTLPPGRDVHDSHLRPTTLVLSSSVVHERHI